MLPLIITVEFPQHYNENAQVIVGTGTGGFNDLTKKSTCNPTIDYIPASKSSSTLDTCIEAWHQESILGLYFVDVPVFFQQLVVVVVMC